MNLKNKLKKPIKISDLDKSKQTEKLKLKLYDLIRQFVLKYHTRYYPHYKGDVEDLIQTIFVEVMTPKSRVKGQEENLLDKYDPSKMPKNFSSEDDYFANLVKTATVNKLIDMERKDKREKLVSNTYNEETGETTLDWLFNKLNKNDEELSEIEFTPETILELRDLYDEMPARSKKKFLNYYFENKDDLYPNFVQLFEDLIGEDTPENFKKGESVHKSNKSESEQATAIKESVKGLENVHIEEHKTSKGDTFRIIFENKEDMSTVDADTLNAKMKEMGYSPYTKRANIWYFIKDE